MDLAEIYKVLSILVVLSPFFISVILLAYFTKKGLDKVRLYPLFWLVLTIIFSLLLVYEMVIGRPSSVIFRGVVFVLLFYDTYLVLKEKR